MNNKISKTQCEKTSFFQLIASGKFREAEKALINQPYLRTLLLHLPGLRHTPFFKKRIRFYRHFAKHNGLVKKLRHDEKQTMRDAFAQSHCASTTLKTIAHNMLKEYENTTFSYRAQRARLLCRKLRP